MHLPKYLLRLLVFTLLISTIPVLLLGLFSYFTASSSMLDKVTRSMQLLLTQTQITVEQNLQIIDHTMQQFATSPIVQQATRTPLQPHEFQTIQELDHNMEAVAAGNTAIRSLIFINNKYSWAIYPGKIVPIDERALVAFGRMNRELREHPLFLEYNAHSDFQLTDAKIPYGLLVAKQIPQYATDANSLAISLVEYKQLNQWIADSSNLGNIWIVNEQMQVMASNNKDRNTDEPLERILLTKLPQIQAANGYLKETLRGDTVYIFYQKSAYTHWTYLSVIPKPLMTKENKEITWATLFTSAGIVCIMLILSYRGSLRMYSPIRNLYKLLPREKESGRHPDEIGFISQSLTGMKRQISMQGKELLAYYVLKLFHGELQPNEIEEKLTRDFPQLNNYDQYAVLVMKIDTLEGTRFSESDRDLLLFAALNIVQETIPDAVRLPPVVMNQSVACLVALSSASHDPIKKELLELGEATKQNIGRYLDLSASIGVSRPFHELHLAQYAFDEGIDALKYRVKFGNNALLFIEDVEPAAGNPVFRYPDMLSMQLIDAVKLNDKLKAHELLTEFIHSLFQNTGTPIDYQIVLIRLLSEIMKLHQFENVNASLTLNGQSLPKELLELQTAADIETWFMRRVIEPIMQLIQDKTDREYKKISDEMIRVIEQEQESDVTLELIGTRLNYSPAYLSQVFRKEKGMSFTDYLTAHRMKIAKIWLLETDLSVNQIAQSLHFTNAQNFIRCFKREVGVTPGTYRAQNGTIR